MLLKNHRILITGGTGSLGTALALELIGDNHIVVISRNEERQFELEQKLKQINSQNYTFVLGRVEDSNSLENALSECTVVIHAAAMKDLIYAENNPYECVHNNIIATQNLLRTIKNFSSVKYLCGISTDKAVSPSSIYGASKLAMESMFLDFSRRHSQINTTVARFGNMIDSRGSLVTNWLKKPETLAGISHPNCSRFFFKVNQAASFILETVSKSPNGTINVPLMKKILIRDLIERINIKSIHNVLGLYPGEKISEKLVADEELAFAHLRDYGISINRVDKNERSNLLSQSEIQFIDSATADSFSPIEIDNILDELKNAVN